MTIRRDFIKKSVIGTIGVAIGGMGFKSKSFAQIISATNALMLLLLGYVARWLHI